MMAGGDDDDGDDDDGGDDDGNLNVMTDDCDARPEVFENSIIVVITSTYDD